MPERFGSLPVARGERPSRFRRPRPSRRCAMTSQPLPEPVDVARTRRAELLAAITALERALAAPARDPAWVVRVQTSTGRLATAFDDHVVATEGPDGMYA